MCIWNKFIKKTGRKLARDVRDGLEDHVIRPILFVMLCPLVYFFEWCVRLNVPERLYRLRERQDDTEKNLAERFAREWRRLHPQPRWDRSNPPNYEDHSDVWEREVGQLDEKTLLPSELPGNLEEAIEALDALVEDTADRELLASTEKARLARFHHTLGRWLRNQWRLWEDGTLLRTWFRSQGVEHADDMSHIIIEAWWHRLNGSSEFDFKGHVAAAKAYWAAIDLQEYKFTPPMPLNNVILKPVGDEED